MSTRPPRLAYLAWVSVCIVWGTTYLGIRVALEGIPPALVGGLRFTVAGAVLAGILAARGVPLPARGAWPAQALLGTLLIAVGNGFVVWAEQWVPSGMTAVVIATTPFWMAGMEAAIPGGERFTGRTLTGMVIGFSGILLLVWPGLAADGAGGRPFVLGMLALQLAEMGWAAGSSYSKRKARHGNALAASAVQMLAGGIVMLVVATLAGEWSDLRPTPRAIVAELYLIVFGSFAGYSAYIYALKYLPVSTVSLYAYVNPVIAVVLGGLLLGEPLDTRIWGAAALVLAGISLVRSRAAQDGTGAPEGGPDRGPASGPSVAPVKRLFDR